MRGGLPGEMSYLLTMLFVFLPRIKLLLNRFQWHTFNLQMRVIVIDTEKVTVL